MVLGLGGEFGTTWQEFALAWLVHCGGFRTKGMAGNCFGAMYTHLLLLLPLWGGVISGRFGAVW